MKYIKYLFLNLLIASAAFGQAQPIRNDTPSNLRDLGSNLSVGRNYSVDQKGQTLVGAINPGSAATNLGKAEDAAHASGDIGVACWSIRSDVAASTAGTTGDYAGIITDANGKLWIAGNQIEDVPHVSADVGDFILTVRSDTLASSAGTTGDYAAANSNDLGQLYVDPIRRITFAHSNPSVTTATSTTIIAANTSRRYLLVQNNTAANICISLNAAVLTGIVPSNTNACIVLAAGATYESPQNACPTAAVTAYQTSGGTVTTITTVEAS